MANHPEAEHNELSKHKSPRILPSLAGGALRPMSFRVEMILLCRKAWLLGLGWVRSLSAPLDPETT